MKEDRPRLFILDGHSMIFRALFKKGKGTPLRGPAGQPTQAVYFFCKMLFALVQEWRPEGLVMALDVPRSTTFRRRIYPAYKANRHPDAFAEDVMGQVSIIEELVEALGIKTLKVPTFEADDVIATVCALYSDEWDCVIVSRDKDMHQLLTKSVRMYDPQEHEWIDEVAVKNRWGVRPQLVAEIQTLMGDSTDNIPGVKGVGPKLSARLVRKYGVVSNIDVGSLSIAKQTAFADADLKLMRELVTLRSDVPLPDFHRDDVVFRKFDMKNAAPIFEELGFQHWID